MFSNRDCRTLVPLLSLTDVCKRQARLVADAYYASARVIKPLLAEENDAFASAPSPVYGESPVLVRYRVLDLMWRPVARFVRFVIVHHSQRGTIFRLCTDLTLEPMPPSELVVASALRSTLPGLFAVAGSVLGLKKIIEDYRRHDLPQERHRMVA